MLTKPWPPLSAVGDRGGVAPAAGIEEDAIEADRSAQRGVVGHRIGTGAGRQVEAEVEQAVPDRRGRLVVGETDHFEIVDLAVDHVGRKFVAQGRIVAGSGIVSNGCT